jgi:hypothetical protein
MELKEAFLNPKSCNINPVRGALLGPLILLPLTFLYALFAYLVGPESSEPLYKTLAATFIVSGLMFFYTYPIVLIYGLPVVFVLKKFNSVNVYSILLISILPALFLIMASSSITQFNWVVLATSAIIGISCYWFSIATALEPNDEYPELKGIMFDDSFVLGWKFSEQEFCIDIELSIWPESEFYSKPVHQEYTCYKKAQLVFKEFETLEGLVEQADAMQSTDATKEVDYGNIDYFDAEGKNFRLTGAFGDVSISNANIEIRWF